MMHHLFQRPPSLKWSLLLILPFIFTARQILRSRKPKRSSRIPHVSERVLVLGASSGIGREIALQYAARGAKVCVVGRRAAKVDSVVEECRVRAKEEPKVIGSPADFANAEDMVRVRALLEKEWGGLDTTIVAAGVSALRPLLEVAGVPGRSPTNPTADGISIAVNAAEAAMKGNYIGPMVAAISLIPFLQNTSPSPSILLVSSLAAVIPAPTRSMYASTKSASLLLYQALSIEHPKIAFSFVLPSTVEGDFRATAVDNVPDSSPFTTPASDSASSSALAIATVAQRCIHAVDLQEKSVFLPGAMRLGHLLYWIWPAFVEGRARAKYSFTAT